MEPETNQQIVDNLCKVTLQIEAGTALDRMNLTPEPVQYEFVFGIGAAGLTPFEFQLASKAPGDVVRLQVPSHQWGDYFRHLSLPGLLPSSSPTEVFLKATVTSVRAAAGREVVKALAEMTECGGCDCGCGGHGGGIQGGPHES
jgi:hypothetical protein